VCETCGCRLSLYAPEGKRFCSTHEPADALNVRELGVLAAELGLESVDLTPPELRPDPALYCARGHERAVHERIVGAKGQRQCSECRRERDRERHRRGRVRDRSGERKRVAA
jgi:hypothetical protein